MTLSSSAALGADAAKVLPEAIRTRELSARLPRYQVAMLEYFAEQRQTNVSDVLARELGVPVEQGIPALARSELFENPFLRVVLRGAGQIPVRRGTGDQAPLEEAARALDRGEVVVIYPEGTSMTENPDLSPMRGKTGAVRLSIRTGVPILPVATWGGQYVWRKGGPKRFTFGRPIWLKAGEPLEPPAMGPASAQDQELVRRLTDELMDRLTVLVDDLRSRYPKRWA